MTPDERKALREKHVPSILVDGQRYCSGCSTRRGMVVAACLQLYPCDVIKVLDALDFEQNMQKIEEISEELGLPE